MTDRRSQLLWLAYLTVGALGLACGKPAADPPTTSAAPSASASSARCLASTANRRPAGWVEAGSVTVTFGAGKAPKALELRDAAGKVVATEPVAAGQEDVREALRRATCRLGGVVAFVDEKSEKDAPVLTIAVLKPPKEDEGADLARVCKEPSWAALGVDASGGLDESQKMRVASQLLEESLTSPKWRGWLFDMNAELEAGSDATYGAIKKKHAVTLRAAAPKDCWFLAGLER